MNDNLDLKYTGNVFVDAGVYALLNYFNISINEVKIDHLKELSLFISNLYLKKMGDKQPSWWSDVNTLFPNSILVNNKFKGNRQEMYLKELNYLIDNIGPITDSGDCIACGNRNSKKLFILKLDSLFFLLTSSNSQSCLFDSLKCLSSTFF